MNKIEHFMLPEHTNGLYKKEAISSIALTIDVAEKINEIIDIINMLDETDLKWKQEQEGRLRKGVIYMKDNLINSLNDLMVTLRDSGFIDKRIEYHCNNLKERVDNLLTKSTVDGELIDLRVDVEGFVNATAGEALRKQILRNQPISHFINAYINHDIVANTLELKMTESYMLLSYFNGKEVVNKNFSPETKIFNLSGSKMIHYIVANVNNTLSKVLYNDYKYVNGDIILLAVGYDILWNVGLSLEDIYENGKPKYRNNFSKEELKFLQPIEVDMINHTITIPSNFLYWENKTGYEVVNQIENPITISYTPKTNNLQFVCFNVETFTLSIVDRLYKFGENEYCIFAIGNNCVTPLQLKDGCVKYVVLEDVRVSKEYFTSINDMLSGLSNNSETFKIVLGGDSITHGMGGTGYSQNGETIISVNGTDYKRSPNSYCWGNLFKTYIEDNYNAIVINNGCSSTYSGFWNDNKTSLIPKDTDLFILSIGTNDRNESVFTGSTKNEVLKNYYDNVKSIINYCYANNINIILVSPIPATVSNEENNKLCNCLHINGVIQKLASEYKMEYVNMYNEIFYHIMENNIELSSLLPDGLHPNDEMYKLMYYKLLKCLNLAPHYNMIE